MVPPSEFESLSTPWKVLDRGFDGFNRFNGLDKYRVLAGYTV